MQGSSLRSDESSKFFKTINLAFSAAASQYACSSELQSSLLAMQDLGTLARTPGAADQLQGLLRRDTAAQEWKDEQGNNILHHACYAGNVAAVRAILQTAPLLASGLNGNSASPLHTAVLGPTFVQLQHPDSLDAVISTLGCVNMLLAAGVSSSKLNGAGQSPLHVAAAWGRTTIVHRLACHAAQFMGGEQMGSKCSSESGVLDALNAADSAGRTPLHLALLGRASVASDSGGPQPPTAQWGYYSPDISPPQLVMLQWLLQQGADPSRCDAAGQLPIHIALRRGELGAAAALAAAFPPTIASRASDVPSALTAVQLASSLAASKLALPLRLKFRATALRLRAASALLPVAASGSHRWGGAMAACMSPQGGATQPGSQHQALGFLLGGTRSDSASNPVEGGMLRTLLLFICTKPLQTLFLLALLALQWLNQFGAGLLWPVFSVLLWRDYLSEVQPWLGIGSFLDWVFSGTWAVAWALYLIVLFSDPGELKQPSGTKAAVLEWFGQWAHYSAADGGGTPAAARSAAQAAALNTNSQRPLSASVLALQGGYQSDVVLGQGGAAEYCPTCRIVRAQGSKHDAHSGVCVAMFDHWCPWTANAVGQQNYPVYLLFVASGTATGVLWMLLYAVHLATCGDSCPSFVWALCVALGQPAWMSAFGGLLCLQHFRLVGRGVTTNEALGWRKYPYMLRQPMHKPSAPVPMLRGQLYGIPHAKYSTPRGSSKAANWRALQQRLRHTPWVLVSCIANAAQSLEAVWAALHAGVAACRPVLLLCCSAQRVARASTATKACWTKVLALLGGRGKLKQEDGHCPGGQ